MNYIIKKIDNLNVFFCLLIFLLQISIVLVAYLALFGLKTYNMAV